MRTREEIEENFEKELSMGIETYGQNKLLLEVLLDIRDMVVSHNLVKILRRQRK